MHNKFKLIYRLYFTLVRFCLALTIANKDRTGLWKALPIHGMSSMGIFIKLEQKSGFNARRSHCKEGGIFL